MARSVGLGLQTTTAAMEPSAVLSTAPASPSEETYHHKPDLSSRPKNPSNSKTSLTTQSRPPQHSTAAQFSYGPATRQTVTTVTTTTTVSFPPLIIKPPKDLLERDPRQYPLAYSPTPEHLKKFCTDYNGQPIHFQEEEDAQETMQRHKELQARLHRHNGAIRSDQTKNEYRTPPRVGSAAQNRPVHNVRASQAPKRATPPSIAEAAELASLQRRTKRLRSHLHLTENGGHEQPLLEQPSALDGASPATPDTDAGASSTMPPPKATSNRPSFVKPGLRRQKTAAESRLRDSWDDKDQDADMADNEFQEEDSQLGPPLYGRRGAQKKPFNNDVAMSGVGPANGGATATPPIADTDLEPAEEEPEAHRRPDLHNILTSSQQDASLPSPSLSPITAAANLASRRNAFDASFGEHLAEDEGALSGLDLDDDSNTRRTEPGSQMTSGAPSAETTSQSIPSVPTTNQTTPLQSGPTMMDIPTMVEAFDGMPEAMQTYLIYQFLRRSAKPTLQMVAQVVNPALKCDPFNVLPAELGLNITRFLDHQSMCRAAQVSHRWRRLINSDERAWRDLLDRDEFVLPEGEIARAVKEGWGWQHSGEDGYEMDLSHRQSPEPEKGGLNAPMVISDDDETAESTAITRQKRKAGSRHGQSSKKLKRRSVASSSSASSARLGSSSSRLNRLLASGPNYLAHAATQAVPHPSVGLPELKNMHLFKSLYQRHYLIRKAWASADSKPQHLAFRAHHRHVVTCLLFDSEKILTGSDDTKINVYSTETGALLNRLDGHEGGVWALQYDGNTLVSGSTDRSVRVWDIKSGRCLQVFHGHTSTVRCLVILKPEQIDTEPDGTPIMMPKEPLIITGSRDSTLRVWKLPPPGAAHIYQAGPPANDRDNPYYLRTLSGHTNSVRAIAAHGDTLVSGSYDCTVRVWKISDGNLVHRLQGHTQKVYSVVLDHARSRCISGSMDNTVKIWDLTTGSCMYNLEGHTSLVGLLDLSHDRLVSAAADSTLRVWDPDTGKAVFQLSAHTGAITCFQHDGHKVISGSDRTLKMWDVKSGTLVRDLLTDLSGVWQVRFDQRRCVAAVQRNALTYIEVLDFGASRDGIPEDRRGRRVVVDCRGREIDDVDSGPPVAAVDGADFQEVQDP